MWIIPRHDTTRLSEIRHKVWEAVEKSRFRATVEIDDHKGKTGVKVSVVRLRRRKGYCGAHPGPCLVNRGRHPVNSILEGLDWVGFNHLINDVLDALGVDCNVFTYNRESLTSKYMIRRGRERRVGYPFEYRGDFAHWTQGHDFDFEDHCGKPSPEVDPSILDSGTPGLPCYTLEEEDRLREEYAHVD